MWFRMSGNLRLIRATGDGWQCDRSESNVVEAKVEGGGVGWGGVAGEPMSSFVTKLVWSEQRWMRRSPLSAQSGGVGNGSPMCRSVPAK